MLSIGTLIDCVNVSRMVKRVRLPRLRSPEAIKSIVVHHTASKTAWINELTQTAIDRLDADTISYHFLIHQGGLVVQCREVLETGVCVANQNTQSLCIAFADNCSEHVPSDAVLQSSSRLILLLVSLYPTITTIKPHSAICKTECPGRLFPWKEYSDALCQSIEHFLDIPAFITGNDQAKVIDPAFSKYITLKR